MHIHGTVNFRTREKERRICGASEIQYHVHVCMPACVKTTGVRLALIFPNFLGLNLPLLSLLHPSIAHPFLSLQLWISLSFWLDKKRKQSDHVIFKTGCLLFPSLSFHPVIFPWISCGSPERLNWTWQICNVVFVFSTCTINFPVTPCSRRVWNRTSDTLFCHSVRLKYCLRFLIAIPKYCSIESGILSLLIGLFMPSSKVWVLTHAWFCTSLNWWSNLITTPCHKFTLSLSQRIGM